MNMKGEARIAGAGSTEDVPACFSFGIVYAPFTLQHIRSAFSHKNL